MLIISTEYTYIQESNKNLKGGINYYVENTM